MNVSVKTTDILCNLVKTICGIGPTLVDCQDAWISVYTLIVKNILIDRLLTNIRNDKTFHLLK
jgi:hypothetical protein